MKLNIILHFICSFLLLIGSCHIESNDLESARNVLPYATRSAVVITSATLALFALGRGPYIFLEPTTCK